MVPEAGNVRFLGFYAETRHSGSDPIVAIRSRLRRTSMPIQCRFGRRWKKPSRQSCIACSRPYPLPMITLLLFAVTSAAVATSDIPPCVPVASDDLAPTSSAIEDHKALRKALGEPMPTAQTMVMAFGRGGHLSNGEYSVILAQDANNVWNGTAVGRGRISVKDAPFVPMKRIEWVLDKERSEKLEGAISRRCPIDRSVALNRESGPPPLGYISERIDIILPGQSTLTYYASEGDGKIASLIRPPE